MPVDSRFQTEKLAPGLLAITLGPDLNDALWDDLEEIGGTFVERIQAQSRPRVMVDLTPLNYMGSAMVALIVRIWKAVTEREGQLVVVNDSETVAHVLEISGLAKKWTILSTRNEAITHFGAGARRGLAWLIVSFIAVLLGALLAADAIIGGTIAAELGRVPLLIAVGIVALFALLCAALAAWRGRNAVRLVSLVALILAGLLLIGSILLIVNHQAWTGRFPLDVAARGLPRTGAERCG